MYDANCGLLAIMHPWRPSSLADSIEGWYVRLYLNVNGGWQCYPAELLDPAYLELWLDCLLYQSDRERSKGTGTTSTPATA